jgi:deoxyribodipyrimidine photolyase-related protein
MEWSIDSYEWVMIPNVMGMSQYASPIMMTRPYFSSSNYINKMSTYKVSKTDTWSEIWDALYYSFINTHENIFKKNYAIARQVKHWNNKTDNEQKELLKIAKDYISKTFN